MNPILQWNVNSHFDYSFYLTTLYQRKTPTNILCWEAQGQGQEEGLDANLASRSILINLHGRNIFWRSTKLTLSLRIFCGLKPNLRRFLANLQHWVSIALENRLYRTHISPQLHLLMCFPLAPRNKYCRYNNSLTHMLEVVSNAASPRPVSNLIIQPLFMSLPIIGYLLVQPLVPCH